jgi:predicted Zn-dependent protease with MMP-like domain
MAAVLSIASSAIQWSIENRPNMAETLTDLAWRRKRAAIILFPMTQSLRPPGIADIERLAGEAWLSIPNDLRRYVGDVVIQVVDFPDQETMDDMELESPFDILGLYRGVDMARRSFSDVVQDVDIIFLYRRPLLDYWAESGEALDDLVRHVLIHEVGHHFGLSDDDMDRIEQTG